MWKQYNAAFAAALAMHIAAGVPHLEARDRARQEARVAVQDAITEQRKATT